MPTRVGRASGVRGAMPPCHVSGVPRDRYRLSPAWPVGGRRGSQLHGFHGGEREAGRGTGWPQRRGEGRQPTASLLSLQVELLPERDLDSDGTKISVSGASGCGQPPPAGGDFPEPEPTPGAASGRLGAGTEGCGGAVPPAPHPLPIRAAS